jgi:hypothetical protein
VQHVGEAAPVSSLVTTHTPLIRAALPPSPTTMSLPAPPVTTSLPKPPNMMLLPAPPVVRSLPPIVASVVATETGWPPESHPAVVAEDDVGAERRGVRRRRAIGMTLKPRAGDRVGRAARPHLPT